MSQNDSGEAWHFKIMKEIVFIVVRWEKLKGDSQDDGSGYLYYKWVYFMIYIFQ